MRKYIITFLVALGLLNLTACSANTATEEAIQEKSVLEQIKEAETFEEITQFTSKKLETEEEREALEAKAIEYVCNNLNGFYYYYEIDHDVVADEYNEYADSRAIYVANGEEVYFASYSEDDMKEKGISLEELPNLDNSELYKYNITGATVEYYHNTGSAIEMTLSSSFVNGTAEFDEYNEIGIHVYEDRSFISGLFADQTTEIGKYTQENILTVHYARTYYSTFEEAKAIEVAEWEERWAAKKADKSKEPAIGMTKGEVSGGAWGYPDDKNIDVYEWGTEEQWVYDDKGYVYFEDGIVTAIQHR